MSLCHPKKNFFFLFFRGIHDFHLEHEPVDLGFGQRVGAFLLDGVLGGHDQKRVVEGIRGVANGHLAFLHGFEQGALHLCRGAVYFVGEYDVRKKRAFLRYEFACFLVEHHGAREVRREQVGRKLYAPEFGVDDFGKRRNRKCLCEAGYAFQKDVTAREESHEQPVEHFALSHNDLVQFAAQKCYEAAFLFDLFVEHCNIHAHEKSFLIKILILFYNH